MDIGGDASEFSILTSTASMTIDWLDTLEIVVELFPDGVRHRYFD